MTSPTQPPPPTSSWLTILLQVVRSVVSSLGSGISSRTRDTTKAGPPPSAVEASPRNPQPTGRTVDLARYPGDFTGTIVAEYAPQLDGAPDPGEIVWTWVPYEEDFSRGKDRPVLLIGHDGGWLLGLMLTSKDHTRDAADEARRGRRWLDIGSGSWDPQGRPSEIRLDRVIRVEPSTIRREGAVMERSVFDAVLNGMTKQH